MHKYQEMSEALVRLFRWVRDARGAVSRDFLESAAIDLPDNVQKRLFWCVSKEKGRILETLAHMARHSVPENFRGETIHTWRPRGPHQDVPQPNEVDLSWKETEDFHLWRWNWGQNGRSPQLHPRECRCQEGPYWHSGRGKDDVYCVPCQRSWGGWFRVGTKSQLWCFFYWIPLFLSSPDELF